MAETATIHRTRRATSPAAPPRLGRLLGCGLLAALLLARTAEPSPDLVWRDSLDAALTLAGAEYRPVLVLFSSPSCGWCRRLREETLGAAEVVALLRQYSLAQVDVTLDPAAANQYQISGVPTLLLLRANGEVVRRLVGFLTAAQLAQALRQELSPEVAKAQDPEVAKALGRLEAGSPEARDWPALMLAVGRREWHDEVLAAIQGVTPFPRQALVPLLEDPRLAVRLGALEILETATGDDFGVDPWRLQADESLAGLARWREWAAQAPDAAEAAARYAPLTPAAVERYLQDLVSEHRDRAVRALRLLARAGPEAAPILTAYLDGHPELPAGARNRVREARILLLLPALPGLEPADIAHKLVFGTLDVRLAAIASLAAGRAGAVPLLTESLAAPEAIVREAAADALIDTRLLAVVPVLATHLQHETDREVVYAILRGLGEVKSRRGQALLLTYVTDPDEDLAVAALLSLGRLEAKVAMDGIVPCLSDPRWRVRAAALETVAKLHLPAATAAVSALLDDPDEFVRHAAVKALAAAGGKKAAPRLQAAFLADDRLKPAVAAAFGQLEVPLPAAFGPALAGKDPELILSVLQAPDGCAARDLWLPRSFAAHANADVAAAALRLLASHGLKDPGSRVCLLRVLREAKSDELAFTVLDALEVDDNVSAVLRDEAAGAPAADEPRTETTPAQPAGAAKGVLDAFGADPDSLPSAPPATPAGADGGSPAEAALDAFLEPGQRAAPAPTAPATPADTPAAGAAGVLAAFGVDGAEQPAPVVGDTPGSVSLRELGLAAMAYLEPKYPERTRRAAALFVTGLGSRAGLPVLEAGLAQATAAERQRVARLLRLPQASRIAGVEALLRVLVDDFAENVRREAVAACLGASRSALINLPFATLMHPDARLRPWDLLTFWGSGSREGATAIAECFRRWARTLVADADPARQTLGLILLERVWQQGDAETVVPFLTAATPWQRRAAAGALGRRAPPAFQEHLAALAADPSEHVRIVLPLVYGKDDDQWVDYVDAEHFGSSFFRVHSFRGSERKPAALPPAVVTVLEGLTRDPVPRVRLEAFLCLLEHRVSVDLARLAATVEALPERKAASGRVASFVGENYRQLGPPFRLLLPYLEGTWQGESMREELNKHFGVSDDTPMPTASPPRLLRPDRPAAVAAEFLPELQTPVEGAARPPVALVYFHSPGCSECERVARLLEELQRAFPNLTVEAHSIRKLAAVRLNEALCQRFAVPEPLRLVTPAVFCSAGPLIRQEITFASLNDKVNRSLGGRREDWITVTPEDLEEAEQAVQDRYAAFRAGVVVAAGLLDGVNPCAFATIIFLLSYLQLAKRRPREIAQVGLAFIAGVFLAYVGLGLGLTEIVARLQVLRQVSRGLNLALAAFVLIVAMLSIRDGVLCLQGRLAAITLQLPDVLKRRIHRAVREGSRQRHFVLAAFVVGVLISFLELACTGQVYAPTIVFMLKSGRDLAGALRYLLLYNLAFVAPLLLIFALAFGGLRSAALTGFLQRHAATVKFATAALFLVLFVLFVFGHRLPYLAG